MKKMVLIGLLLSILSFACEPIQTDTSTQSWWQAVAEWFPKPSVAGDNKLDTIQLPPSSLGDNISNSVDMEKKMTRVMWLNPGKVYISNLSQGAQAEWNLRIHNEKETENSFSVYVRAPDYTAQGYEKLPPRFYRWVEIPQSKIVVPPEQIAEALVRVKMGNEDWASQKNYEIWIAVMDESQKGMVRTEICSRWFISTQ